MTNLSSTRLILLAALVTASSALAQAGHEIDPELKVALPRLPDLEVRQKLDESFYSWQSFELPLEEISRTAKESRRMKLQIGAHVFDLFLTPIDLRSENYRELWNGEVRTLPGKMPPQGTYKGVVAEDEEAIVRILALPDLLQGYIKFEDEWYFIDPMAKFAPDTSGANVVFYRDRDVRPEASGSCGSGHLSSVIDSLDALDTGGSGALRLKQTETTYEIEIATEADFEYYQRYGSSSNNQIAGVINQVDGIYLHSLNLRLKISLQSVWASSNDPYTTTNASSLLSQFRSYWNTHRGDVPRDVAHLFTGKVLDGLVAGVAYVAVACRTPGSSYAVSRDHGSVIKIVAHEIGHNLSALHDTPSTAICNGSGPVMCPVIQIIGPNEFSDATRNQVRNYVNINNSCLRALPNAKPIACMSANVIGTEGIFHGGCSTDDGFIKSWAWSFGDGSTGSGIISTHTYTSTGTFYVTLTVTDNNGATSQTTQAITVCAGRFCRN